MAIDIATTVPDQEVTLHDGTTTTLAALTQGRHLVLFFYPKAFTGGCTAEACHFRDLAAEFEEVGAVRVGVSGDEVDTQARFAAEHGFDFPLIADTDGSLADRFGTKRLGPLPSKRETFVLDPSLTLVHAIRSETDMERHADEALRFLHERTTG